VAIETWTNMKLFKNVIKSLYSSKTNVVLSWKGIFYQNMITWGFNYVINLGKKAQFRNTEKLCNIVLSEIKLFEKMKSEVKGNGFPYFD
jgi:hypothetical protein